MSDEAVAKDARPRGLSRESRGDPRGCDRCHRSASRLDLANAAVQEVGSLWNQIQQALVAELLDLHNDSWADPEHGRPVLSAAEFLQKLVPETIDLDCYEDDEATYTMYFGDSQVFGGHGVQLRWSANEKTFAPEVSLVG
jgi:hypothetical protein